MSSEGEKIVVVDLDGTLAEYEGWTGEWAPIGEPISDVNGWTARDFMLRLQERGYRTIVYSSRGDTNEILHWLEKHGIPCNAVNWPLVEIAGMSEKPIAVAYVDDRAVRFVNDYQSALVRLIHLAGKAETAGNREWGMGNGETAMAHNANGDEAIDLEVSPAGEAALIAHELADIADVTETELADYARAVVGLLCKRLDAVRGRLAQLGERIVELQRERDGWREMAERFDDEDDIFGDGG